MGGRRRSGQKETTRGCVCLEERERVCVSVCAHEGGREAGR